MIVSLKKNELIKKIIEGFDEVTYPGDNNLVEFQDGYESSDVYQHFKGLNWKDMQTETDLMCSIDDARNPFLIDYYMSYLLPKAYIYYLPGTMMVIINSKEDNPVVGYLQDILVWNLMNQYKSYEDYKFVKSLMGEYREKIITKEYNIVKEEYLLEFEDRYSQLNTIQAEIVAEFLVYLVERYETYSVPHKYDEGRFALSSYWKGFLSENQRKNLITDSLLT